MDISQSTNLASQSRNESPAPSPDTNQKPEPHRLVERLFARFTAIYGARFTNLWAGTDPDEMKRTWFNALTHFDPHQIGRAITLCESDVATPPTLPQFVTIVKSCRRDAAAALLSFTQPAPNKISDIELDVSREYPKSKDGFGVWWACRIVRLAQLKQYDDFHGITSALSVLGIKNIDDLQTRFPSASVA